MFPPRLMLKELAGKEFPTSRMLEQWDHGFLGGFDDQLMRYLVISKSMFPVAVHRKVIQHNSTGTEHLLEMFQWVVNH